MKYFLSLVMLYSILYSADKDANISKKEMLEKHIQKEMENEKKYAIEQRFYTEENYDFKGAEVNEESLKHIKEIEVEEFDMDDIFE